MITTSPRKAIANHCKGCIYDPCDTGNWRQQVEACSITACDLYQHRPLTAKTTQIRRESYLASLTHEQRELAEIRSRQQALNMHNLRNQPASNQTH